MLRSSSYHHAMALWGEVFKGLLIWGLLVHFCFFFVLHMRFRYWFGMGRDFSDKKRMRREVLWEGMDG